MSLILKYLIGGGNDNIRRFGHQSFIEHLIRLYKEPSYKVLCAFRIGQCLKGTSKKIFQIYYYHCSRKNMIEMGLETSIGDGIVFAHGGPVVINANSKIGQNCIIHPCVLIGGNRLKKGYPIIGDNVFIGHGTKIIGNPKIGNYVFISPGAIITRDIPDDSIIGSGVNNILKNEGGKKYYEAYGHKHASLTD